MNQKQKIFTVPNLLSVFRLLLIPLIVWLYREKGAYGWALAVLILSGLTDIADGFIARRWNLVSDLGKALDPVADKLTQICVMWCLVSRFPYLWLLLGVLMAKELFTGIMSLCAVKKSGKILGADWHGKLCTALLYGTIGLHILWGSIPEVFSKILMAVCMAVMCLSGLLYWYRNYKLIKGYL